MNPKQLRASCLNCGLPVNTCVAKYCSSACQQVYQYKKWIEQWKLGLVDGGVSNNMSVSNYVRRWLIETGGYKCSICGITQWCGQPVPLIVDHIDGNAHRTVFGNVRLVCGNCNMQLPTFAGRNRGHGRLIRRTMRKCGKWT